MILSLGTSKNETNTRFTLGILWKNKVAALLSFIDTLPQTSRLTMEINLDVKLIHTNNKLHCSITLYSLNTLLLWFWWCYHSLVSNQHEEHLFLKNLCLKINPLSYLSRVQLKYLCDLGIPLLLCSFACRQCWILHFSIQSNELLLILLLEFWEISRGFLRWLRWLPSLRHSPRWRKREHCCH